MLEFDAGNGALLNQQPPHLRLGHDSEIAAFHGRAQKGLRRVPADAGALVDVEIAGAFVAAAIEICRFGNAGLLGRLLEGIEHIPADARLFHAPFATGAMHLVLALIVIFRLAEIRQHVVPAPAGAAHLPPEIVVAGLTAHIDHAVDRGTAAEHLATRIVQRPPVQPVLGRGRKTPVGTRIVNAIEIADGNMDPVVVVVAARLQQQDPRIAVGR